MVFQNFVKKILKPDRKQPVVVVSGLPRSGTSMMMKMLEAGGLATVQDGIRKADENNPKGYYEFERVKKLKEGDFGWVASAQGKVVKVISALLEYLPPDYTYQIVFMRRNMEEILASQKSMLVRDGKPTDGPNDHKLSELYEKHLQKLDTWLSEQPNMQVLYIHYNETLKYPQENIHRLSDFLGGELDTKAMQSVVDRNLYRERKATS